MSDQEELTFMQKIEKFRTYAHRPLSSDSDLTEETHKSESSNESDNSFRTDNSPDNSKNLQGRKVHFFDQEQKTQTVGSDETDSKTQSMLTPQHDNHEETTGSAQGDKTDENFKTLEPITSSESETETTNIDVGQGRDIQMHPYIPALPSFSKDKSGFNAGQIFYINEKTSELSTFMSFEELSKYLMEQQANANRNKNVHDVMNSVVGVSARNIVNHVTVGDYLKQLYDRNQLIDVVVDVRGEKFPAHRVVLCCHSTYFSNLFSQNKSNKIPFDLKIKGISADAFASFLQFCYTGDINVYPEIAADLLIVSDYLQVSALKKRCAAITGTLPIDQALKFIVNSKSNDQHKVYRKLYERVLTNFSAAMKFDEFLEMDIETLCKLMTSDELVIQSEMDVFQAAIRWIVHNIEERVKYTMRLMTSVRFCHMSSSEIVQCVETTSLVRTYDKFREIILISNWQRTSFDLGRDDPFKFPAPIKRLCFSDARVKSRDGPQMPQPLATSTPRPKSAKPVLIPPDVTTMKSQTNPVMDILMIGGHTEQDSEQTPAYVERYDTRDNQWVHFCKLPVTRIYHAVVVCKGKLYLIGGCEHLTVDQDLCATKSMYELVINTKKWTEKADMLTARHNHCACAVHGKVYAIGGKDKDNCVLRSVECYNPQTNSWTYVCPMNSPRFAASAARLNDSIVVVGGMGVNGGVPSTLPVLNTVECYNIENDSWHRRNNLRNPRCHASLVSLNDSLYLCCGATRSYNFKSSVLVSVASLDRYDADEDVWCHVADMVIPRQEAGVVAAGEKLFIMGGVSTVADRALQSVECYDTQTAKWISGLQDLPSPVGSIGCVTVASKWQKTILDDLNSHL